MQQRSTLHALTTLPVSTQAVAEIGSFQSHIPDDLHLTHPAVTTSNKMEPEDVKQKLKLGNVTLLSQMVV